jgi:hypothetical protein
MPCKLIFRLPLVDRICLRKKFVEITWGFKDSKEENGGVNDKIKSFIICAFHQTSLEISSEG